MEIVQLLAWVLVGLALINIHRKVNKIMAKVVDLDTALDNLMATINAKAQQVADDIAALQAKIDAGASGPDLQPEVDKVNGSIAVIQAIDPQSAASVPGPSDGTTGSTPPTT